MSAYNRAGISECCQTQQNLSFSAGLALLATAPEVLSALASRGRLHSPSCARDFTVNPALGLLGQNCCSRTM